MEPVSSGQICTCFYSAELEFKRKAHVPFRNVLALMYHLGNTAEIHLKEVESNIKRVKEYQEYLESMMDRLLDMVRGK